MSDNFTRLIHPQGFNKPRYMIYDWEGLPIGSFHIKDYAEIAGECLYHNFFLMDLKTAKLTRHTKEGTQEVKYKVVSPKDLPLDEQNKLTILQEYNK